ncbi:hypothetical protein PR202_ga09700 [Eleusine coracana subsp. coracana]|uniref:CULT domain-containing protein n=1 Tax=Eleusine coracana subsp. coracana TaxID=191504 RepID=A0AAV5C4S7_ELECO|nr:hypothetical protein PR202_ga09700 [Eleusine coracana subsp. coracana]
MLYLENFAGVVLFPEAALSLRVIQTRLLEAIDKAVSHVDAPCMIGVVHVYQHTNDSHHTIASVGTMAKIRDIQLLDDGSSCVLTYGQQRFLLRRRWLDADGITLIARRSDMVMVSSDGPVGTYMKLRDHANEMIIVYNVTGLALRGDPSKAYSLFPGYTWTIALCSSCESNIGWMFTSDKKNLHPKSFWAIRTSQVSDDMQSR